MSDKKKEKTTTKHMSDADLSQNNDDMPEIIVVEDGQVIDEAEKEKNKLDDMTKAYRYLQADFDNYRRRMMLASQTSKEQGRVDVIEKLLPIIDVMTKAQSFINDPKILEGFKMILDQHYNLLSGFNVKKIDTLGMDLDTKFHNVVATKDDEKNAGKVVEVFQDGYQMGNIVIRPAQVIVGK
ncbi:MAG: nucleotide exchange factor GrpE [Firmicutes bacterium]|nr:nucleotide exchange factor GrpE [Bacillota bacterium]